MSLQLGNIKEWPQSEQLIFVTRRKKESSLIFIVVILVFLVYEQQGKNGFKKKKKDVKKLSLIDWRVYRKGFFHPTGIALEQ